MKTFPVPPVIIDSIGKYISRFDLCSVHLFHDLEKNLGVLPAVSHKDQLIYRTGKNEQILSERFPYAVKKTRVKCDCRSSRVIAVADHKHLIFIIPFIMLQRISLSCLNVGGMILGAFNIASSITSSAVTPQYFKKPSLTLMHPVPW